MINDPQSTPTKKQKLHKQLQERGLYTKDYQEFTNQFSAPEKQTALYKQLKDRDLVTIEPEEFQNRYFSQPDNGSSTSTEPPEQPRAFDSMATSSFRQNGDPDRSRNPLINFGKTFWNVGSKQIPALMQAGAAALDFNIPNTFADELIRNHPRVTEERKQLLQNAMEGMEDFQQSQAGAVTQTSDINDAIDAVNWVANSVGQAAAQIPAAVLSRGLTSAGQEIGIIYMDQVKQIADREGITPDQVIEQGLDDQAAAAAYGVAAGSLDLLGATQVMRGIPFDKFKSDIARRGLTFLKSAGTEGLTESAQSAIEQFGASQSAGESLLTALTDVNMREALEEGAAGAVGGGGINIATQVANNVIERGRQRMEQQETVEPVEPPRVATEQDIETPQPQTEEQVAPPVEAEQPESLDAEAAIAQAMGWGKMDPFDIEVDLSRLRQRLENKGEITPEDLSETDFGAAIKVAVGENLHAKFEQNPEETLSSLERSLEKQRSLSQQTTTDQPAQQTSVPEETTTQPEPIISFDQPTPVLEGNYQIEFTEGDTVIRDDYQVDTQRTPVVTNTRTGQPVGRSSRNYAPALAEYFTRLDDSGKRVDVPLLEEGTTLDEGEYVNRVAQESESPTEILEAIDVHQQIDPNSPAILDDAISNVLWQEGYTITRNDLEQFTDPAMIEGDQGRFYRLQLQQEGTESTDLANLTQMVNDRLNTDYSTSDIMDHWLDYHDARRNQTDPTLNSLKQRFEEITGEPYSPRLARETAIRQDAQRENASEQEMRMADDVVSKVSDNVFDEQGEIIPSEFASEIEQLQQTDPQLADYLTQQPDEQARQQQIQQETAQQTEQLGLQDRPQSQPVEQTTEGDTGVTQPPSDYGQSNRIINREDHEQNRRELLRKLGGRAPSNPFMDAQALKLAAKVALFHIEAGARKFGDFANAMINDLGDQIKPYLRKLYQDARTSVPEEVRSEMSPPQDISAWEQQNIDEDIQTPPPYTTNERAGQDVFSDGFTEPSDSVFDMLRVLLQDRFLDLKRYQQTVETANGPLDDVVNAYMEEELYTGQTEYNIDQFTEQFEAPIIELINDMGWSIEQAENYLVARHAPERNRQIESINPENQAGSGITTEQANRIVNEIESGENAQQARELARLWDEMVAVDRDIIESSGLESSEMMEAWKSTYDHYVSLRGDIEAHTGGAGFDLVAGFKRATGRTSPADNAIPNTFSQIRNNIVRAQKAEVGQALLRFVQDNPNPEIWEVDVVSYNQTVNPNTGLVERRPDPTYKLNDNVVNVKVNGENHHITFHTERGKRLAKGLKNLGSENSGVLVKGLYTINRFLALLNTGLNPEFVLSNFIRDIQTAGINLSGTQADNVKGRIIRDVFKAQRGMFQYMSDNTESEWARHAENFVKNGGKTGWIDAYKEMDTFRKDLEKQIARLKRKKADPRNVLRNAFDFVQKLNDSVENGIRLSAFVHARENGLTDKQAASLAKNLTVNFNRRGTIGPLLNSLYLFYGASVQGSIRIFQAVKNPKVRAIVGGALVGSVGMDILNRIIGGIDDEDDTPYYDKIPQWVKERNLIIMLPGTEGDYFTIPSPYGYNVINVAGMEAGRAITNNLIGEPVQYSPWNSAVNIGSAFLDSFNPVGQGGSWLQTLAPTSLDPFVQTGQNIDWTGQPIKPPENPYDLTPIPESQQFYPSAPEWAKYSAKRINELTGGSEVRPGLVSMSPEYMEHWFRFMTGGVGNFVDESSDAIVKTIQGEQIEPYRIPFAGRLYGEVSDYQTYTTYRNYVKRIEYANADLEDAYMKGDESRIDRIESREGIWLDYANLSDETEGEIIKLRRERKKIEQGEDYESKEEDIEFYNEQILQLQKDLIREVRTSLKQE